MATWGAYFSSYVKKAPSPAAEETKTTPPVPAAIIAKEKEKEAKWRIKPATNNAYTAPPPQQVEDPGGFQRSDSSARMKKKLYEISTEPETTDTLVQRSASNAARLAKMFGNTNAVPAPISKTAAQDEGKPLPIVPGRTDVKETVRSPISGTVRTANSFRTAASTARTQAGVNQPQIATTTKPAEGSKAPTHTKAKSKADIFSMLDDFAAQADTSVTTPAIKSPVTKVRKPPTHSKAQSKADIFSMLDDFAAQAGTSDARLPAKMENESKTPRKATAHTKAKSKADIFSMLDDFAAQAEAAIPTPQAQANKGPAHAKAQSKADIFYMLDDFAAQADASPPVPAAEMEERRVPGSCLTKLTELDDFFEEEDKVSAVPASESMLTEEGRSLLGFFSKQVAPPPAAEPTIKAQVMNQEPKTIAPEAQPKAAGKSIFGFFAKQAAPPTTSMSPPEEQLEDDFKQTLPLETKPKFDLFANIAVAPEPARAPVRVERPGMKQTVGRTMSSATNVRGIAHISKEYLLTRTRT
jgi:hypothetical protein